MDRRTEAPTSTLAELIAQAAHAGDHVYVEDARGDRRLRYAELLAVIGRWQAALDRIGAAGDRVLLDVFDPVMFTAVHLAVIASGRTSVPVDPKAPAGELARTVRLVRPSVVISSRAARWGGWFNGPVLDVANAGAGREATSSPTGGGAVLLQTSGSTGDPKLVRLTERQLLTVAVAVARHHGLTPDDRGYNALPLFHVNGQVVGLLATLVAGATLVLSERFHRTGFWALMDDKGITWINAVPAILGILARADLPPAPDRLRFVRSASAPLSPAVRATVERQLGVPVVESYGMTEAASQITAAALDGSTPPGSAGRAVGTEVQVRRHGADASTGRVWIRGPGVITGYEGGRGADRFDREGWLDTGDDGWLDDAGHLFLAGRADDVINRGGEMVYPREVEEVLLREPAVVDAVVVARPDEAVGGVPVAYVVPRLDLDPPGRDALAAALTERAADELSRYKQPAEIVLVDDLPRASVGKIRRRAVAETLPPAGGAR
jgi:oxalate---CoA ligase